MARNARFYLVKNSNGRADLSRRAIAALIPVMSDEGRLHRMEAIGRSQALNRRDFVAFVHDRERQARIDPETTDKDGAGTALAVVAPFFGTGQFQIFAERIEQCGARIDMKLLSFAVYVKRDTHHAGHRLRPCTTCVCLCAKNRCGRKCNGCNPRRENAAPRHVKRILVRH